MHVYKLPVQPSFMTIKGKIIFASYLSGDE